MNQKKCVVLQGTLNVLEKDREVLRKKIAVLEKDLEGAQRKLEDNRKHVENLDKKRTLIDKGLQRAAAAIGEHNTQIHVHNMAANNIQVLTKCQH